MPHKTKTRPVRRSSRHSVVTKRRTVASRSRSSARRKRQPRRILGLRWHHISGLALLVIGIVTFLIIQPLGKSVASSTPPSLVSAAAPSGYSEVWGDEFNGTTVDSSKWNVLSNSNYGASNDEDECYETANIGESGGTLNIMAEDERSSPVKCGGANPNITSPTTVNGQSTADNYFFTSGFLTSRDVNASSPQKYSFQYGYVEAAIEMPKGNPFWGAFWLVGDTNAPAWPDYGEFDIMEQHGIYPDNATGTIHYPGACSGNNCSNNGHNLYNILDKSSTQSDAGTQLTTTNYSSYSGITSTSFVRYGFLWEPDSITWYINGYPLRTLNTSDVLTVYTAWDSSGNPIANTTTTLTAPSSQYPFSTIFTYYHTIDLNLSVGGKAPIDLGYNGVESADGTSYSVGSGTGALTTQSFPATMKVDYVRIYQADTTPPSVSLNSPVNGATVSGTLSISGSASDNVGVSNVELFLDGKQVGNDTSSPYSFSIDTTKYGNGSHSLYLEAFDAAGNHATSSTATVTISNTAPAGGGSGGGGTGGGSPVGGNPSPPASPVTTISVSSPPSSTPIPVKGDLTIAASPGSSVGLKIDGQTVDGNTVNTSKLTNGKHLLTITEDGKTKTQAIVVNNPLPTAIRNYLRVHRVAYVGSTSFVLVIFLVIWFGRRRLVSYFLQRIYGKQYARSSAAIKSRR